MNAEELKNILTQRRETMHSFYAECEKDPTISIEIDLKILKEAVSRADGLLKGIAQDVIEGIVPEAFYTHLCHNIEQIIPRNIPTSFWPKEVKVKTYKDISKRIIDVKDLCETYTFYKTLGFAQKNTVLVGANGCGKTSLANLLKKE